MSDLPAIQAKHDDAARLLHASAERRAVAVEDMFLPGKMRLSERERLTARSLLDRLTRAIEDGLRAGLAQRFQENEALHAALVSAHVEIAGPTIGGPALLADPELVSLLLRRVEEHRVFLAAQSSSERLQSLIADGDAEVAANAMAVLVARSRRLDRFQDPILARTELPAELQHRLVWTIGAAFRTYMIGRHRVEPAVADRALGQACAALIFGYDEGDSLEARCTRLAQSLYGSGRLDGAAIADFLGQGTLPLFLASLSATTGIPYSAVWEILRDPRENGPVHLLRAAGLDRQQAGQTLVFLAAQPNGEILVEQIALFDVIDARQAGEGLGLWLLDPAYRDALLRLAQGKLAARASC